MPQSSKNTREQLTRATHSLHGLSCGDAFGERFFIHTELARSLIGQRAAPSPPWRYTDDTAMAIAIVEILEEHGEIRQDSLAKSFGRNFLADHQPGYGPAMHTLLPDLASAPSAWKKLAPALFKGAGSFGNGAAMRVAPLGAYFADDFAELTKQAELSAVITHSHPEGVAGAIAVALAAALAWRHKSLPMAPRDFLQQVCERTPESEVRRGLIKALALPADATVKPAVAALGNGSNVSAQDTVPFALWSAAYHLDDYQDALWTTVSGLGDRDTTCAIVGGIVALSAGVESIPLSWIQSREPLPAWFLYPRIPNWRPTRPICHNSSFRRQPMGKFILGVIVTVLVLILGGLGFAMLGFFPTNANVAPPRLEKRIANGAVDASMERHAPHVTNPVPPTDQNFEDGMKLYTMNCALCHGGLDRKPASLSNSFYPPAPNLISDTPDDPEWHIYYTIRTGVRYSGMPSWEKTLSEQDMWKITSFISHMEKLPPAVQDYWKTSFGVAAPGGDENKDKEEHKHD